MAQKFLFIMSKGFEKAGGAVRAMQLANLMVQAGHQVEVFLIDDSIHWAQIGVAEGIRAATGEHMQEMLDGLLAARTPIHVCKACADKRLIGPDDLIEGAVISPATKLVELMADPAYKVFTF